MNWSKIAALGLILVIVFCVGFFGAHFGYKVNGIPHGGHSGFHMVKPLTPGDANTSYMVYFDDGTTTIMTLSEIKDMVNTGGDIVGFMMDLGAFRVDGIPIFMGLFFDILILLLLFLIATSFIPFLPGG